MASGDTSPVGPSVVEPGLEAVEGDLADDRVQRVLDLAGQQRLALLSGGVGQQAFEHQAFAEDRGGFRQGQRRVGQQGALGAASVWCTAWPSSWARVSTSRRSPM